MSSDNQFFYATTHAYCVHVNLPCKDAFDEFEACMEEFLNYYTNYDCGEYYLLDPIAFSRAARIITQYGSLACIDYTGNMAIDNVFFTFITCYNARKRFTEEVNCESWRN